MFSWEILGTNLKGVPTGRGSIRPYHTHMTINDAKEYGWYRKLRESNKPTIYIVRDIRGVLVSQFYFMVDLQTDLHGFIHGKANPRSMIRRGEGPIPTPAELYPCIQERIRKDPIRAWIEHTKWIDEKWVDFYRFEDIVEDQLAFIEYIKENHNVRPIRELRTIDELVGIKPRKGIIGDWANHISDEDLKYIWSIAGDRMEELGYGR
jgi:hypothetical protein